MATPRQVAEWMLDELRRVGILYQETAVYDIEQNFGEEQVYINQNGNPAISTKVLAEFRTLTGDSVVWNRGDRYWRFRRDFDQPGRQQNW